MTSAPKVHQNFLELINHTHFCAEIRHVAEEKERRIHGYKMNYSLIKAADDALSIALLNRNDDTIRVFENVLSYSVEIVLTNMAHRSKLEEMFERSTEKKSGPSSLRFWTLNKPRSKIVLLLTPTYKIYPFKGRGGIERVECNENKTELSLSSPTASYVALDYSMDISLRKRVTDKYE